MPSGAITYQQTAQYNGGWSSWKDNSNGYFGKSSSGGYYATVIRFRTPAFVGESTSLSVSIPAIIGYSGGPTTVACRLSVTTNDPTTGKVYIGGTPGTDSGRVYSGDITFSGLGGSRKLFPFTVNAKLQGNTVYYLVLSASGTKNQFGQVSGSSGTTGTVSYIDPVSVPSVAEAMVPLGESVTIRTNRKNSGYAHILKYRFGSGSGTIAENVGEAHVWKTSVDLAAHIPNDISGECEIICETYRGGTKLGSEMVSVTLTVPATVKPTAKLTAELVDTSGTGWGLWIQGLCRAKLKTTAAGAYGSAISSYSINGTSAGAELTTGLLKEAKSYKWTVTVTDSRGRSGTDTVTAEVLAYQTPTLSGVSLYRCGEDGTSSEDGTSLYAKASAGISDLGGRNSGVLRVELRSAATGYLIAGTDLLSGVEKICFSGQLNKSLSYVARLTLADTVGKRVEYREPIPTSDMAFQIRDGGKGAAFGKYAEEDGLLDVAWDIRSSGKVTALGGLRAPGEFYTLNKRVDAGAAFSFQSWYTTNTGDGGSRQSVLLFGADNSTPLCGLLIVPNNGNCTWLGIGDAAVSAKLGTDGRVTVTMPRTAYDNFILLSARPLAD